MGLPYVQNNNNKKNIKRALPREKMLYSMCTQQRLRSFCTFAQYDSSLFPQSKDNRDLWDFAGLGTLGTMVHREENEYFSCPNGTKIKRFLNEIIINHHFHLPTINSKHISKINMNILNFKYFKPFSSLRCSVLPQKFAGI